MTLAIAVAAGVGIFGAVVTLWSACAAAGRADRADAWGAEVARGEAGGVSEHNPRDFERHPALGDFLRWLQFEIHQARQKRDEAAGSDDEITRTIELQHQQGRLAALEAVRCQAEVMAGKHVRRGVRESDLQAALEWLLEKGFIVPFILAEIREGAMASIGDPNAVRTVRAVDTILEIAKCVDGEDGGEA